MNLLITFQVFILHPILQLAKGKGENKNSQEKILQRWKLFQGHCILFLQALFMSKYLSITGPLRKEKICCRQGVYSDCPGFLQNLFNRYCTKSDLGQKESKYHLGSWDKRNQVDRLITTRHILKKKITPIISKCDIHLAFDNKESFLPVFKDTVKFHRLTATVSSC